MIGKKRPWGQVSRFCGRFAQSSVGSLGSVLGEQFVNQALHEHGGRWRERIYGPMNTLELFIEQVLNPDHSCQDAVARGLSQRVALGEAPCSLNTGPFCKARTRLSFELIESLRRELGSRLTEGQPRDWGWRGRPVKLVDGSTVSMPDTRVNQQSFPQNREQAQGVGFPVARIVAIISMSNGAVLDWSMGPCEGKRTGETAMLWEMAANLVPGDVLIMDRYYAGYFMLARLQQQGVDVVVRANRHRQTDFRCGKRLGKHDHLVHWQRPTRPHWMDEKTYQQMPESLQLREARVRGVTLVSTLVDAKAVDKQELFVLYDQRWNVELDFRSIKTVMQMETLRCKTPEMVKKEVAVHLLAYNLVRAVMAQAAVQAALLPRQLSFKTALQLINAFHQVLRHAPSGPLGTMQAHLIGAITCARLRHRPGRHEPRVVKRRPKQYPRLSQPRNIARKKSRQILARNIRRELR